MIWNVKFTRLTALIYFLAILSLAALYVLVFYQFFFIEELEGQDLTKKPELVSLRRLQQDWITKPYVELKIKRGTRCDEGWEKMFTWQWEGTRSYCLNDAGTIHQDESWHAWARNGKHAEVCPSGLVSEIHPVNVTKFADKFICARRGGDNFLHATRPDYTTGECPGVLVPCSNSTHVSRTICTHPDDIDECPITVMEFFHKSDIESGLYDVGDWHELKELVISKDFDDLPKVSTLIDTDRPCINSNLPRESRSDMHDRQSLDIELAEYTECEASEEDGKPLVDKSYNKLAYSLTAYEVMTEAGIFNQLERLPKYHDQVEDLKDVRDDTVLNFYAKSTAWWRLRCESDPATSKETFHHLLETIGFTEQDRHGEILSHEERQIWIFFFLSQVLYLTVMLWFLVCACCFIDKGGKYSNIQIVQQGVSLLIFNLVFGGVMIAQIEYAKDFAAKLQVEYTNETLREHFVRISDLLTQCGDGNTQFDISEVSHLFESNEVQTKGPMYQELASIQIGLVIFFIVMTVTFYAGTMAHYTKVYKGTIKGIDLDEEEEEEEEGKENGSLINENGIQLQVGKVNYRSKERHVFGVEVLPEGTDREPQSMPGSALSSARDAQTGREFFQSRGSAQRERRRNQVDKPKSGGIKNFRDMVNDFDYLDED